MTACTLQENVKTLVSYVIENFWSTLQTIEYVDTFKALRRIHEQEMDRRDNKDSPSVTYVSTRYIVC